MEHVHYDLDQVEKQIRAMFAKARAEVPPAGVEQVYFHWQNRAEDIMVSFVKWGMSMEMEGVSTELQGRLIGIQCAELIANFANGWAHNPVGMMEAVGVVMDGLTSHLNQNINRLLTDGHAEHHCEFEPVAAGKA